jgi:hypothetical protein
MSGLLASFDTRPTVPTAPNGWPDPSGQWYRAESPGMLGALGFSPGEPARRHEGEIVPTGHECRADVAVLRRTAAWLLTHPARARAAGVACDEDVVALAVLLELLADEAPYLDATVRRELVEACREALG